MSDTPEIEVSSKCHQPLAVDLFCGLGGWADGLLAEGYEVVGYDLVARSSKGRSYPGRLRLADVSELDGEQFADAALIVASPPCQQYSYMALPWRRAKEKAAAIRADVSGSSLRSLNRLFDACFRIQREAESAAGRKIPLVVENVRGAQDWVGPARGRYGSFYLWGDVPALLPIACGWDGRKGIKAPCRHGVKGHNRILLQVWNCASNSVRRAEASAEVAKIPLALSRHVAACYKPRSLAMVNEWGSL